jgi:hypothetical protein
MDDEPHAVHPVKRNENPTLWKAPRSQRLCQVIVFMLPWWRLDCRITVDPMLIHRITGLSMQGPDPQDFYPGKSTDWALAQKIKDTYDDVEKGMRGYKVASIKNGAVHLSCQLIAMKS